MKIHEYQAKALLAQYRVPVPEGKAATTPAEAREVAQELGGRVVVKAQVHAGGRGKAGGIKVVGSPQEAEKVAGEMLGSRLVTHQTSSDGVPVDTVLVERAANAQRELYVGIVIDGSAQMPVVMASEAGGMEIEEVAAATPEKIVREYVDPVIGLQPFQGRRLADGMGLSGDLVRPAVAIVSGLYRLMNDKNCSLVEVNPLIVTDDGKLLALDAKLNFDDDALFRHPEIQELRDLSQEDPLDVEANKYDINYIKLDGDVGCMVNGAGLAMATMDIIHYMGASPANFLDVGGGANEEKIAQAFKLLVSDPKVKRVLVNIFGGILRCDVAARGIVAAAREIEVEIPVVVRMRGTNVEEGQQILEESGLNITFAPDLKSAAEKVVAAKGGR
ncbi:MAG: ADP-forming succinate--CoA ligase subunit beta [Dehalococcoidia bacterium]